MDATPDLYSSMSSITGHCVTRNQKPNIIRCHCTTAPRNDFTDSVFIIISVMILFEVLSRADGNLVSLALGHWTSDSHHFGWEYNRLQAQSK